MPAIKKNLLKRDNIGLLYILPWFAGFVIFAFYPIISSLYYSFTDYRLFGAPVFTGIGNYIRLFNDPMFYHSLRLTFIFVIIAVPLRLIFSLFIAMLLKTNVKMINLYRTVYYLPSIFGGSVAIGVLWRFVFIRNGLLNSFLEVFNIPAQNWLGNPDTALYVMSLLPMWQFGSSMLLFLAALKQIPESLFEAATIDGAGRIKKFTHITLPMITPIILFNVVMQTINAFQEFSGIFIVTSGTGGPVKSTYVYAIMLYDQAFVYTNMGYASALSWILFVLIIGLSLLILKSSKRWVFYSDGGDS